MFLTFIHFTACAYSSFILIAGEFNIVKLHHTYLPLLLLMNIWGFSFSFFTNFLVHTFGTPVEECQKGMRLGAEVQDQTAYTF